MKIEKIEQIDNITVADSFVRHNKIGSGAGEARLYVGTLSSTTDFFDVIARYKKAKAFILKADIARYLSDSEFEYKNPSYPYRSIDKLDNNYILYTQKVYNLSDIEKFEIEFALDKRKDPRCYIRACDTSNDSIYTFLREILLPEISKLSIIKVLLDNKLYYWFVPRIDVQYNKYNQQTNIDSILRNIDKDEKISETSKLALVTARKGQGVFRKELLNEMVACAITFIDDTRLLEASHIKPWSDSSNIERIDIYNGLLLTPTMHTLFDQGLVTFEKYNKMLISPYLSDKTVEKLKLTEYSPNIVHFDERKKYLEFHQENIFKSLPNA